MGEAEHMKKSPIDRFRVDASERAKSYKYNDPLQEASQKFMAQIVKTKYVYNFFWLGVPIIQLPQDVQALQEVIWEVKPDIIIETGIAWGGSIIFSASMLVLLEACGEIKNGQVVGVDIDIRAHNKEAILAHPFGTKITLLEGSSIDKRIVGKVTELTKGKRKVLVCLDSNHTHDHVLAELRAYAPLVSVGSYCVVEDTGEEDLPAGTTSGRPWGKGNNPKTAILEFIRGNEDFVIDKTFDSKLVLTGSPDGYLKRVR